MGTTIRVSGAIDRHSPDPTAPGDPQSSWIGMITVSWVDGSPRERPAAVIKIATGRGTGDKLWGASVLVLRWIGDPPPPEIAQAVYDLIRDGGPGSRLVKSVVESQPRTESQPSYRSSRAHS